MREASRLRALSQIARALAAPLAEFSARSEEMRRAVAVLIVLESNQAALSRGEAEARQLVSAVALALARSDTDQRSLPRARDEGGTEAASARAPERALENPERKQEAEASDRSASVAPSDAKALGARGVSVIGARREGIFDSAARDDDERPLPAVRRRAFTRFGGLLFLLGLMEALRLPEEMFADPALRARTFRWMLHRVALALAPDAEAGDAAVLAVAGLLPDDAPPSEGEDEPRDAESEAVAGYAARVAEELKERLRDWQEEPAASLLRFVCRRRAEIVADPGWFEVRLSLDEVTTEIRRAGLDLDPGYLRWLGAVVKFVYE
jgi:hypothetical protein